MKEHILTIITLCLAFNLSIYAIEFDVTPPCDGNIGSINLIIRDAGDNNIADNDLPLYYPAISYEWSNGATTRNLTNVTPGIYFVTVSDGDCDIIEKIFVPECGEPPTSNELGYEYDKICDPVTGEFKLKFLITGEDYDYPLILNGEGYIDELLEFDEMILTDFWFTTHVIPNDDNSFSFTVVATSGEVVHITGSYICNICDDPDNTPFQLELEQYDTPKYSFACVNELGFASLPIYDEENLDVEVILNDFPSDQYLEVVKEDGLLYYQLDQNYGGEKFIISLIFTDQPATPGGCTNSRCQEYVLTIKCGEENGCTEACPPQVPPCESFAINYTKPTTYVTTVTNPNTGQAEITTAALCDGEISITFNSPEEAYLASLELFGKDNNKTTNYSINGIGNTITLSGLCEDTYTLLINDCSFILDLEVTSGNPSTSQEEEDDNHASKGFVLPDASESNSDCNILLTVFPNGFTDQLNVKFKVQNGIETNNDKVHITLSDLSGRVQKQLIKDMEVQTNQNYQSRFNLSGLPQGVYIIHIKNECGASVSEKVIKF